MRTSVLAVSSIALAWASTARSADELKFGSKPAWAETLSVPTNVNAAVGAPIALLLTDQQILLEPGKITLFSEIAMKIQTAEGLAAGNISLPWNPATDTVTIHKLHILRNGQTIDVLAGGQKFTMLRRESNLETAVLDGRLTANIQPEGLQEGDVINLAMTLEQADPVLGGHAQSLFADWDTAPIQTARAKLIWSDKLKVSTKISGSLPKPLLTSAKGQRVLEIKADSLQPTVLPKGAPSRFQIGRLGEASDFQSWAEVAALMQPLYAKASVIPSSSSLRGEIDRIRKETNDPARRTELALTLVQDRIRYVALLMGSGGYVPATAEETWGRRFGDCKAKTALLLGLLNELGIEAEPVLVSSTFGDGLDQRQPMLSLFNHVLVRAHIAGKTYWLDGTRSSDGQLASLQVPKFRWGLPVVANAALVPMVPEPLILPSGEKTISIDASQGIIAPVPVTIERVLRGDVAIFLSLMLASATPTQRDEFMRATAKEDFDSITVKSSKFDFNRSNAEMRMSLQGEARLDWDDSWYAVPAASIAYSPDFERSSGPNKEAPYALGFPSYETTRTSIKLPPSMIREQKYPVKVGETVAGVKYERSVEVKGGIIEVTTSEKVVAPEISYKEATAASARLKKLSEDNVYLRLPENYVLSKTDFEARKGQSLSTSEEYVSRGNQFLNAAKVDEALADFTEAAKIDPKNVWAYANLGIAYVWKDDTEAAKKNFALADAIELNNPVVSRGRGLMFLQKGDFNGAVEQFTRSLERDPKNGFALMNRARAYASLNNTDAALADTEAALQLTSIKTEVRLFRANLLVPANRFEDAAKEAEQLIVEQPQSDLALVTAARILARVGKREHAMRLFDDALSVAKKPYIYVNRAQTRPLADQTARLSDLEEALKLEPENPDALAVKADVLSDMGRASEAVTLYDKLIRLVPQDALMKIRKAGMMWVAGDKNGASQLFDLLRKDAKTPYEFNNLCWEKATLGILLESALKDCQEAVQKQPTNSGFSDSLGMVLLRLKRYPESVAAYDKALVGRQSAVSLMGRAFAHAGAGNHSKADADRIAARKLDPEIDARFAVYGLKH